MNAQKRLNACLNIVFPLVKPTLSRWRLQVVGERENGHARGRHARGEGAPARKALENRFNSHSVSADISNWSRGKKKKKVTARGEKTLSQ